jgi:hypothetical protein
LVRKHYPQVAFGYFNPSEETQAYYNERRTR